MGKKNNRVFNMLSWGPKARVRHIQTSTDDFRQAGEWDGCIKERDKLEIFRTMYPPVIHV